MKDALKRRPAARPGRLPRELAAKVGERILDAAEQVFLQRGFEGSSVDEIADVARAGKTTIYSRYAGKQDLFAAVVLRNVSLMLQIAESCPQGATVEARLRHLGAAIIERAMSHNAIRFFRVTLSEAERLPEIASQVSRLARERGIDEVARLLGELDDAPLSRPLDAQAGRQLADARIFVDLVVLPMVLRSLFGESPEVLRAEIPDHVADRVGFFLVASKKRRPAAAEARCAHSA
jgi:AcrR family transcriptional regulator